MNDNLDKINLLLMELYFSLSDQEYGSTIATERKLMVIDRIVKLEELKLKIEFFRR